MENKKASSIKAIERVLNSEKLTKPQRETLSAFDRFNELEVQVALSTRKSYLENLCHLGVNIGKPFEKMTKEDLQNFIAKEAKHHEEGTIALYKQQIKRFFRWLEWVEVNKAKPDEEKEDIKDVKPPYKVRWIKFVTAEPELEFEDLPTDEEIKRIAECVSTQRDRALLLTLWETGASPIEILGLRVKDVTFNQYGATVRFRRYTRSRTRQVNKLKTPYRYRQVPIATSVPDLQLWLSMHQQKDNPEAPLWLSQMGGALSYSEFYRKFKLAVKKSGIKKKLKPYLFRHKRLTQVAPHLGIHELKRFAGHSKYSNITPRYLHADDKAIQTKVLKERGVEVKPETPTETPLKVKVCPRCKHRNSPTYRFCAMCSMPLDTETLFNVQRQGERLVDFVNRFGFAIGVNDETKALVLQQIGTDEEHQKRKRINPDEDLETFLTLIQLSPKIKQLYKRLWETVALEILKMQEQTAIPTTAKAKTT